MDAQDWTFESAVDAVVAGDIERLRRSIDAEPTLVRRRSAREHRATLLHYVAANGVQDERQKTPANVVEIATMLLSARAEVDALAETYGFGNRATPLGLLVSSVQPVRAGLQGALVDTLADFGAALDGIDDDGSPLLPALWFHRADARKHSRAWIDRRGRGLGPTRSRRSISRSRWFDEKQRSVGGRRVVRTSRRSRNSVELALVWAAAHRHAGVVEFLLENGVSAGATDPRTWTALHWAALYGYPEIAQLLLQWNAPLESKNEFGGTPLDQTLWTIVNEEELPQPRSDHRIFARCGCKRKFAMAEAGNARTAAGAHRGPLGSGTLMARWSDVRRLALTLAETTEDTSYDENRAWRVGGKLFAWERPLRKADLAALGKSAPTGPILGVRTADLEMKEALLARDSRVYFTTPHFDGYPAVLVRLQTIGLRELKALLFEAWLARAPKRLANERAKRP